MHREKKITIIFELSEKRARGLSALFGSPRKNDAFSDEAVQPGSDLGAFRSGEEIGRKVDRVEVVFLK